MMSSALHPELIARGGCGRFAGALGARIYRHHVSGARVDGARECDLLPSRVSGQPSGPARSGPGLLSFSGILHLTGITPALSDECRETVYRAIELARSAGLFVSFDPNLRLKLWPLPEARRVLLDLCGLSDLVLVGIEEGKTLFECDDEEGVSAAILAAGAKMAVIKLGEGGACLVSAKENVRGTGLSGAAHR